MDLKKFAFEKLQTRHLQSSSFEDAWSMLFSLKLHGFLTSTDWKDRLFQFYLDLRSLGKAGADNGLLMAYNAHLWGCLIPILHFGSDEQHAKYLKPLMEGRRIGAGAVTDESGGSHLSSMGTKISELNGDSTISGKKCHITNAPVADVFLLYAKQTHTATGSLDCYILERGTKGLTAGPTQPKSGLHFAPFGEILIDKTPTSAANRLGAPGGGQSVFNHSMVLERTFILAAALGRMERLSESAKKYAASRSIGEKKLIDCENIQETLAEMFILTETSRLAIENAVRSIAEGRQSHFESSLAKLQTSHAYIETCNKALEIFGARGYLAETGIEQELRDALASKFYSGTSHILKKIILGLSPHDIN